MIFSNYVNLMSMAEPNFLGSILYNQNKLHGTKIRRYDFIAYTRFAKFFENIKVKPFNWVQWYNMSGARDIIRHTHTNKGTLLWIWLIDHHYKINSAQYCGLAHNWIIALYILCVVNIIYMLVHTMNSGQRTVHSHMELKTRLKDNQ